MIKLISFEGVGHDSNTSVFNHILHSICNKFKNFFPFSIVQSPYSRRRPWLRLGWRSAPAMEPCSSPPVMRR